MTYYSTKPDEYRPIKLDEAYRAKDDKYPEPDWRSVLYDSNRKAVLGKTGLEWLRLMAIYGLLYLILAVWMFICMIAFLEGRVSEDIPSLTGQQSLLRMQPALSFRPNVDYLTTLIRFIPSDPQTYTNYVQNLRAFTQVYELTNLIDNEGFADCTPGKPRSSSDVYKVCKFKLEELGHWCQRQNNFGYDRNMPCIIIKINNVYGWIPDIIDKSQPYPLVKCRGQNEVDVEHFGNITYSPSVVVNGTSYGYFSTDYYPYLVQASYRQPLMAVQFFSPKRHVVLMVECELFNVRNKSPNSAVRFELLVD